MRRLILLLLAVLPLIANAQAPTTIPNLPAGAPLLGPEAIPMQQAGQCSATGGTCRTTPAALATYVLTSPAVIGPLTQNNLFTASSSRAFNVGTTSDTIPAGSATTYETANTISSAFTATLAAPVGDGERRRICFKNVTGTITWTVTAPATATLGLPTAMAPGGCVEIIYNAASGVPANAPATTWLLF